MSVLPGYAAEWFTEHLGKPSAMPVSGGDSNHVALVSTDRGTFIAKWKPLAPPHFFLREAEGLDALRRTQTLRVPRVVMIGDYDTPFLVLEYIPAVVNRDERVFTQRFAEGLAALHHHTEQGERYGWQCDNFLGSQPQPNNWRETWPEFYRDNRLLPQIERARTLHLLPAHRERALTLVANMLGSLLDSDTEPALIHGDLWSGNYLCAQDNTPVLIDPAVHYADREVEIAFIELFGGFPSRFVAAYDTVYPLADGYERRRPVHQLYPLLVHLCHFGEAYGAAIDTACRMILA